MDIWKKLLILPPVLLALGLFMMAGKSAKPPQAASAAQEKATAVKIIGAKPITVIPAISGYGKVRPERQWDAVAQVAGPVIWTADSLRGGLLVVKGTELLRIDPREYELGLAQIDAQLDALDARDLTNEATLVIEQRSLDLLDEDLARKRTLFAQGSSAQASVDAAERAMLTAKARVQALVSALKLNEAERQVLMSQRDIAALNVERTIIRAPFDLRLDTVAIARGQYVNKGETLFTGDGIAVAEVVAQFPVGAMGPLFGKAGEARAPLANMAASASPSAEGDGEAKGLDRHALLQAVIRLRTPTTTIEWPARVDRVAAAMDPKTRTRGIILKVEDPYGQATPGARPPLVRDTAVEVILKGQPRANLFALPANAVRKGMVMVADADKRLRFRAVEPAYLQGDIMVLASGLEAGDKVIVSDMPAPIEGMLLAPRPDKALQARVMAEASGKPQSGDKPISEDKTQSEGMPQSEDKSQSEGTKTSEGKQSS